MRDSKTARQARLSAILAEEDRETSKEEGDSHGEKRKYLVNECLLNHSETVRHGGGSNHTSFSPYLIHITL